MPTIDTLVQDFLAQKRIAAVIPGACPNQYLKPDFGHAMMRTIFRTIGFHKVE